MKLFNKILSIRKKRINGSLNSIELLDQKIKVLNTALNKNKNSAIKLSNNIKEIEKEVNHALQDLLKCKINTKEEKKALEKYNKQLFFYELAKENTEDIKKNINILEDKISKAYTVKSRLS